MAFSSYTTSAASATERPWSRFQVKRQPGELWWSVPATSSTASRSTWHCATDKPSPVCPAPESTRWYFISLVCRTLTLLRPLLELGYCCCHFSFFVHGIIQSASMWPSVTTANEEEVAHPLFSCNTSPCAPVINTMYSCPFWNACKYLYHQSSEWTLTPPLQCLSSFLYAQLVLNLNLYNVVWRVGLYVDAKPFLYYWYSKSDFKSDLELQGLAKTKPHQASSWCACIFC